MVTISFHPDKSLERLVKYFTLKPVSIIWPKMYLEGKNHRYNFWTVYFLVPLLKANKSRKM